MEAAMFEFTIGNLLEADAEALVNTVNTVGVMGKGIALQFKQAFPDNFKAYEKAAKRQQITPGKMFIFETGQLTNPRIIINFPTKRHWRGKARIEDIEAGLLDLVNIIQQYNIHTIAIPPLGCGNGGLNWEEVKPLITGALEKAPGIHARIYIPSGSPVADKMPVATRRPDLTLGRAAIIELMAHYALPGYRLTHLEIQKLAYFLQIAGEPLRLDFEKNQYGPYAENLNYVLQRLEGHYLRGYGARSGSSQIYLLPGAEEEAQSFLIQYPETQERLSRVLNLIKGFETPYGMELLATVHWLSRENDGKEFHPTDAIEGFKTWNKRKREHFREDHIHIGWDRLKEQGWI
jgi:O-acetyl-ADP-ribose deacetylase (regulator of RNase III)